MKKRLAAIASVFTFSLIPVFSQAAPAVDPAVVQATREMLDAVKMRDVMAQTMRLLEARLPEQIRESMTQDIESNPTLSAEQKRVALAKMEESVPVMVARVHAMVADPGLVEDIVAEVVPLYAKTYTLDEIRQLTAFYQSPLGRKMLASTPRLMGEVMDISNRVMAPRLQKLMSTETPAAAGK